MTTEKQKPAAEIRDGNIKAVIWRNQAKDGAFYSVEFLRTYVKPGSPDDQPAFEDSGSFSGTDILKVMILAERAYLKAGELRQADGGVS